MTDNEPPSRAEIIHAIRNGAQVDRTGRLPSQLRRLDQTTEQETPDET